MSATPTYASVARQGAAKSAAADTAMFNPSTNVYTVITGVAAGTRIDRLIVKLNGTAATACTANVVRLWINDGTTNFLYKDVAFAASTPSATAASAGVEIPTPNLILPSASYSVRFTVHTRADARDDYTVTAFGGDMT